MLNVLPSIPMTKFPGLLINNETKGFNKNKSKHPLLKSLNTKFNLNYTNLKQRELSVNKKETPRPFLIIKKIISGNKIQDKRKKSLVIKKKDQSMKKLLN